MNAIYDDIGQDYARRRRADPRIAAAIHAQLGDARSVINVGAGAGSYEPSDRVVQAVEPSALMIAQRPVGAAPCAQASAEALPFEKGSFDAAMAVLTIHHWSDWRAGLREMRRVARKRVILLTFDVDVGGFWLTRDYLPELHALDEGIMPKLSDLEEELGAFDATSVPVPHDCIDGFLGAYWRRPELYLDASVRASMSSFARIDARAGLDRLAQDLAGGAWQQRYGHVLQQEALDVGYRLIRWDL
jgi:SAM-dependent methyltransferase